MFYKKLFFAVFFVFVCVSILIPAPGETQQHYVKTQKQVYSPDEAIIVEFGGLPGSSSDWITIIKKDRPDNQYGQWFYTKGEKNMGDRVSISFTKKCNKKRFKIQACSGCKIANKGSINNG